MTWRDAPATYGIAAVTILVSTLVGLMGQSQTAALVGGFIPALAPYGAVTWAGPAIPQWLTPLTATLLHGGVFHLLFNMVMFVYCGREAERALGSGAIGILYFLGAYSAAAGQWAQDPQSMMPMIGASGAISAIVAAYALLYGRNRARKIGPLSAGLLHALWLGAAWTIINLLVGYATLTDQPVAIGAHIGGFLAGLVLTRPLLLWRYRDA
jgi:membrane associated rhomboid family serine protease